MTSASMEAAGCEEEAYRNTPPPASPSWKDFNSSNAAPKLPWKAHQLSPSAASPSPSPSTSSTSSSSSSSSLSSSSSSTMEVMSASEMKTRCAGPQVSASSSSSAIANAKSTIDTNSKSDESSITSNGSSTKNDRRSIKNDGSSTKNTKKGSSSFKNDGSIKSDGSIKNNSSIKNDGCNIKNDGNSITNDGSSIKNDGSSIKNDGSNIKNDGSSVENDGGSSMKNDGSGIKSDGSGLKNVESSIKKDESSIKNDGSGIKNEGSGIKNDGSGIKNDGSGIKNDGSGIKNDGSSIKNDGSGIKNDGSGIKNEGSAKKENGNGNLYDSSSNKKGSGDGDGKKGAGGEKLRSDRPPSSPPSPATKRPAVAYLSLFRYADWLDALLMLLGAIAGIIHGAALPVFFIFLGKLIDSLGALSLDPSRAPREVNKYALYFVYLGLVRFASGWIEVCMWMYTGDRQSARIRTMYVKALITQDVGFFDTDISTGEVVMGISSDTSLIQDAIGVKTGNLMHYFAQFIAGFVLAFMDLWQLTLLTLAVMPIIVASGAVYGYIMVGLSSKSQQAYARAGEIAHEVIVQVKTVQAFVGEEAAARSYAGALQETRRMGRRAGLAKGLGIGVLYGIGFGCFSLLLWYAGRLVRAGQASGGLAFTTILNVVASCLALGQAAPDMATISRARVSGYTVFEMIRRKPQIARNRADGLKLEKVRGEIELREIVFSYPSRPDVAVFDGFSLSIPPGKVVAIVGSSGSGKSTVISLIERFYDPTAGEVLLDGHNIKSMELKWLREQMGLVSQEPSLFAASIADNIRYGKLGGASMDEVVAAAKASCAHGFIDVLPKRYETQVGERGAQLSGGQKQRIAIARAMLKNPAILLLDEATSALDSESEKSVQEALDKVMLGRTTVVVAHRLSTVQAADMIAFVHAGRVLEAGPHSDLLLAGGPYAALVQMQRDAPLLPLDSASSNAASILRRDSRNSRGSFSGSVSQRTFSFRSTAEVASTGMGMKVNEIVDMDELMGPRPSFKRLLRMNAREWPYGFLSMMGAIGAGALTPLFGLVITQALVYFNFPDPDYMRRGLAKNSLLCCALGAMAVFAYTFEFYFSGVAGENVTMRVRKLMFSAILRNEVSWFDQNNSTLLSSRLATDAPLVRTMLVDRFIALFQNLGLVVTAFIITFNLQWKIALVMVATLPALVLSNLCQVQFAKGFSGDLSQAYMKANVVAAEAVSNIRTVAAFSAEDKVMGMYTRELGEPQRRQLVRGQVGGIGFGVSQMVLFSSYGLALWYSGRLITNGEATFGEVMKCFMVLMITAFGIAEALGLAPDFLRGADELRAVFRIVDRQTGIDACDPKAQEVEEVKGAIEFRHVDFSYPTRPEVQIFRGFDLKVRRGQSMALVGTSGSGKSSVIALIARFYDPQAGRVMVDGRDIRQLKLSSLRRRIGLVQQEPALFSTSIYENIRYGREDATEADIVEAARAANAHGFISALPEGYNTEVGESGVQLSGGQRQRVAIARAVLRDPAILLLDEATSALDAESERLVQDALDMLMRRRTTILVAHRLSTIQNADSIAVLQAGSIAEQGTHQELLAKQGAYFHLLNLGQSPLQQPQPAEE